MSQAADRNLATEQFRDLNRQFYEANPADYFGRRIRSLLLEVGEAPGLHQIMMDGVRYGAAEIRRDRDDPSIKDQRADDAYAALEATNLLHHAAECFLRLYLAHADEQPCPWLEIARLRAPRQFKERVEGLRSGLTDLSTVDALRRVFFGGSDPAALGLTLTQEEWQRKTDGLTMLVNHLCDTVLGDAGMYNATKHGLAAIGGDSMLALGSAADELSIHTRGLALTYLDARTPRSEPGTRRWNMCVTFVRVEASLGVVEIARRHIAAMWMFARHRYTGAELGEVPIMLIEPDALRRIINTGRGDAPIGLSGMAMELAYYRDPEPAPPPSNGRARR